MLRERYHLDIHGVSNITTYVQPRVESMIVSRRN